MTKCSVVLTKANWINHTCNVKVFERADNHIHSFDGFD